MNRDWSHFASAAPVAWVLASLQLAGIGPARLAGTVYGR
jgi:hypothetical protein